MTQPQYCPYCGASWLEDAAFCMQCGRTLPLTVPPIQAEREQKPHKPKKKTRPKRAPRKASEAEPELQDIGYDGYYEDVPVSDGGAYRNQLDRDLVKRIVLVSAAAIVVVILSIALMQLL